MGNNQGEARFKLEGMYKKLFIQVMGQRWREHKSKMVTAIIDASKRTDSTSKYAMLKPDNIRPPLEWNNFVKEKLSEEFQEKSKKFKEIRAKNNIPHTMSRKGYARLEDEMKKQSPMPLTIGRDNVWCKGHTRKNGELPNAYVAECVNKIQQFTSSQISPETSLNEDGVSNVFGPERNGRVRGLGFGVTPSQLGVQMHNAKKSIGARGNDNENLSSPQVVTPRDVTRKCKLLNWQKKFVAEGTLASMDPNALVHHIPLGLDVWKIWVDVALEPGASLWRPTSEMSTIEHAVGSTVAWHKEFISFD